MMPLMLVKLEQSTLERNSSAIVALACYHFGTVFSLGNVFSSEFSLSSDDSFVVAA